MTKCCIKEALGNQENRIVIYDNKIIDYINFIMRAGDFEDCSIDKILSLRESISNLVISLIEENGPGKTQVALEVKDTLDKKAVFALMTECYENHQVDKKKLEELKYISMEGYIPPSKQQSFSNAKNKLLKGFRKKDINQYAEEYMDVGFRLYLILSRMIDVDPKLLDNMKLTLLQQKAYNFYKKNCRSIEVVKDDELQKVNFRVKSKRVLREEVKEMLKWNVDRSSPSNKIRDLMDWSKDIMKDIDYQRRILSNPLAIVLTKGWLVWNHMVTVLSFALNILMLMTWNAKMSLSTPGIMQNTTEIPPEIKEGLLVLDTEDYSCRIQRTTRAGYRVLLVPDTEDYSWRIQNE